VSFVTITAAEETYTDNMGKTRANMPKKTDARPNLSALRQLAEIEKLKRERLPEQPLEPRLALLKAWQARRMARTYADLLAAPRYRLACGFFLSDIYAPRDFSQRDHDILEMYAFMQRFVPEGLLRPLTETLELYNLTQALDDQLLQVLVEQLGVDTELTEAQYAQAYRLCDNYVARVRQIEMICKIGESLDDVVRLPLTGAALQVAKVPARRAGWTELTEFMERGFQAFKNMRGAEFFLKTIRKRERLILDRIYAAEPAPFNIDRQVE
jgi:hypothetical protein